MGTYTDFTGAIRITPCLKEPLAGRFRQFLGCLLYTSDLPCYSA